MKDRILLSVFVIILLAFGLLLARKYVLTQAPEEPVVTEQQPPPPASLREIQLYFTVPDAPFLEAEGREIEDCQVEEECLRNTIQELIEGPVGDLAPIMPRQTVLRRLTIEGDLVVVDFSQDFVNGHPGGSLSELMTVYGLVDSLAVNYPYVRQLRILVEGEPLETIKGHVDLRSPVSADFRYTRSAEPAGSLPIPISEQNSELQTNADQQQGPQAR